MTKRRSNKEGSIWKDRKKWRAGITLEDGKRVTRTFSKKSECNVWLDDIKNKIRQGMHNNSTNTLLRNGD